jgi:hypothetical protein
VLFLDRNTEQAQVSELAPQVGGELVVASICAARGAISLAAKSRTLSRSIAMVSP